MRNSRLIISMLTRMLFGGLLLCAHSLYAAPQALNDTVMQQVTAGGDEADGGGTIIGNSSQSISDQTVDLDLNDQAQQAARVLNLVNSVGSAVANTVNIWDGREVVLTTGDVATIPTLEVNQVNQVTQEQLSTATLSGYSRPDAERFEMSRNSASNSSTSRQLNVSNTTNIFEEQYYSLTETTANINTLTKFNIGEHFYFEGNLGQGIASAGHAEVHFDGGSSDIAMVLGGGISVDGGIGIGSDDLLLTAFDPDINLGSTEASAGVDISASIGLTAHIELPKLDIVIDGAGCGVVMGSCNASSTVTEYTETYTDNSTLEVFENHQSGESSFSEENTLIVRSSFKIEQAEAEYIVVDDSKLELESDITLELSDSAQKELEGMNVVNAISSNVANTTNISRASQFQSNRSTLILNQMNIVRHGH